MGILDDYMTGSTASAPSAEQASKRSIINTYMNAAPSSETPVPTPKGKIPDVSIGGKVNYITEEEAARRVKSSEDYYGNRRGAGPIIEGVKNFPSAVVEAGKKNYIEGYHSVTQGASNVLKGNVGKGAANTALGAVQLIAAPANAIVQEGIEKPVTELTGNPEIGNRAGMVASTALPIAPGAGYVVKNLPKNKALTELVDKITSGGRDQQALVDTINAMKADSRIGPADTSPAVLNMSQKLFTTEGDAAKNYLFNASKDRVGKLAEDVKGAYDELGGVPVNVVQKLSDLSAAAKKAGTDLINPALASAKPVNITKTLEGIDAVLKPGVWSKVAAESSLPLSSMKKDLTDIRKYLANKTEMRTDANDLHSFQSSLRRTAEGLLKSSVGSERQLGQQIMNVRNSLVNDIEASAKGYKEGLAKYREEMHIADNFREGYDGVFSNSTKMENRPEFTEQWFKSLTDHEKEAVREGARLAIDSKMGASQNASLAGTNLGRSDFNQQKLELLFGKEETEKLLRNLENTRAIKNTDQKIIEGSQTEMRRAGDQAVAMPVQNKGSITDWAVPAAMEAYGTMQGAPGVGGMIGTALLGAKAITSKATHAISVKLAKERNLHLAEMSLPVQGPKRDELIKQLESFIPGPKQSLISRVAGKLPIAP